MFESFKHIAEYIELNHSWVCDVDLAIGEGGRGEFLIKVIKDDDTVMGDAFFITPEQFNLEHIGELVDERIKESNASFDKGMAA